MFRLRSLKSLVRDLTAKIDTANNAPTTAAKVEQLLAVREENHERMLKLERQQGDIGFGGFLATFGGMGMMMAGFFGTAAVLASPLFLVGTAVTALAAGTMAVMGQSLDVLRADRDTIKKHINREVGVLAKAEPKEAEKSPLFLKSLYSVFNDAAKGDDKSYQAMVAKIAPVKTPTPATAA